MKKTLKFAIVLSLLCNHPTMIYANENVEESNNKFDLISETKIFSSDEIYSQLTFFDGENIYISEIYDGEVYVYDSNLNLLASATFAVGETSTEESYESSSSEISTAALIDTYDQWRGWYATQMVKLVPKFETPSISESVLSSLIYSALTNSGISVLSVVVGYLSTAIAHSITSGTTVYVKGDYNYNKYCSILRKERVNRYNSDGTVKTYGKDSYSWQGAVWDYATTDASCRVLVERYP